MFLWVFVTKEVASVDNTASLHLLKFFSFSLFLRKPTAVSQHGFCHQSNVSCIAGQATVGHWHLNTVSNPETIWGGGQETSQDLGWGHSLLAVSCIHYCKTRNLHINVIMLLCMEKENQPRQRYIYCSCEICVHDRGIIQSKFVFIDLKLKIKFMFL